MKPKTISDFWDFVLEREKIRLRKLSKQPRPWTQNILLQNFVFCNIRREHDHGTVWYMEHVVPSAQGEFDDLLWKTVLYRAVNNVQWFEQVIEGMYPVFSRHEWQTHNNAIRSRIDNGPPPWSPAYIILQSPDGKDRKTHLYQLLEFLDKDLDALVWYMAGAAKLEEIWKRLQKIPYVGPFIALQIYRDLMLAGAFPNFSDNDFTYLGPGARKGLEILSGQHNYRVQYEFLKELLNQQPEYLEPKLTLGDLEHCVCEARKFWGLEEGGGRHRLYKPRETAVAGSSNVALTR